jgi:hypothetical protein
MYWTKAFDQELSRFLIVSDAILEVRERGGTHHRGEVAKRAIRLLASGRASMFEPQNSAYGCREWPTAQGPCGLTARGERCFKATLGPSKLYFRQGATAEEPISGATKPRRLG